MNLIQFVRLIYNIYIFKKSKKQIVINLQRKVMSRLSEMFKDVASNYVIILIPLCSHINKQFECTSSSLTMSKSFLTSVYLHILKGL